MSCTPSSSDCTQAEAFQSLMLRVCELESHIGTLQCEVGTLLSQVSTLVTSIKGLSAMLPAP